MTPDEFNDLCAMQLLRATNLKQAGKWYVGEISNIFDNVLDSYRQCRSGLYVRQIPNEEVRPPWDKFRKALDNLFEDAGEYRLWRARNSWGRSHAKVATPWRLPHSKKHARLKNLNLPPNRWNEASHIFETLLALVRKSSERPGGFLYAMFFMASVSPDDPHRQPYNDKWMDLYSYVWRIMRPNIERGTDLFQAVGAHPSELRLLEIQIVMCLESELRLIEAGSMTSEQLIDWVVGRLRRIDPEFQLGEYITIGLEGRGEPGRYRDLMPVNKLSMRTSLITNLFRLGSHRDDASVRQRYLSLVSAFRMNMQIAKEQSLYQTKQGSRPVDYKVNALRALATAAGIAYNSERTVAACIIACWVENNAPDDLDSKAYRSIKRLADNSAGSIKAMGWLFDQKARFPRSDVEESVPDTRLSGEISPASPPKQLTTEEAPQSPAVVSPTLEKLIRGGKLSRAMREVEDCPTAESLLSLCVGLARTASVLPIVLDYTRYNEWAKKCRKIYSELAHELSPHKRVLIHEGIKLNALQGMAHYVRDGGDRNAAATKLRNLHLNGTNGSNGADETDPVAMKHAVEEMSFFVPFHKLWDREFDLLEEPAINATLQALGQHGQELPIYVSVVPISKYQWEVIIVDPLRDEISSTRLTPFSIPQGRVLKKIWRSNIGLSWSHSGAGREGLELQIRELKALVGNGSSTRPILISTTSNLLGLPWQSWLCKDLSRPVCSVPGLYWLESHLARRTRVWQGVETACDEVSNEWGTMRELLRDAAAFREYTSFGAAAGHGVIDVQTRYPMISIPARDALQRVVSFEYILHLARKDLVILQACNLGTSIPLENWDAGGLPSVFLQLNTSCCVAPVVEVPIAVANALQEAINSELERREGKNIATLLRSLAEAKPDFRCALGLYQITGLPSTTVVKKVEKPRSVNVAEVSEKFGREFAELR